jgi:hypothetical protein
VWEAGQGKTIAIPLPRSANSSLCDLGLNSVVNSAFEYDPGMAGYSGTPLPKKLGIKPGHRVVFMHAPSTFAETLGELPDGITVASSLAGKHPIDVVVTFHTTLAGVERDIAKAAPRLAPAGGLWIAWPKKTSGVATDCSENPIRELGLLAGLVDNKVCAIDETWSGLRFVIRVKDRAARE